MSRDEQADDERVSAAYRLLRRGRFPLPALAAWVSPTQEHPHVREDARRIAREALTERGRL